MTFLLRVNAHLRDIRSLVYLLEGRAFEEAYTAASDAEKEGVEILISACQSPHDLTREYARTQLHEWMKKLDQSEISVNQLQLECRAYGVKNYSRLTKLELIAELQKAKSNVNRENPRNLASN